MWEFYVLFKKNIYINIHENMIKKMAGRGNMFGEHDFLLRERLLFLETRLTHHITHLHIFFIKKFNPGSIQAT